VSQSHAWQTHSPYKLRLYGLPSSGISGAHRAMNTKTAMQSDQIKMTSIITNLPALCLRNK
jgi:hypothetical protein